jgi:hypothetical protein
MIKNIFSRFLFVIAIVLFSVSLSPTKTDANPSLCALQGYCDFCGQPFDTIPCSYLDCGYGTIMCYQPREGLDR